MDDSRGGAMTKARDWPVATSPLGPVTVGTVLWRHRQRSYLTVAVKASCALLPDRRMRLADPVPLHAKEQWSGRRLVHARETVPVLPQAEVVAIADAYPPPGRAAERMVTFAAMRDETPLFHKTLRVPFESGGNMAAAPIERVPLTGEVLGIAPMPSSTPSRADKLRGLSPAALEEPIAELPDDFDWHYFQSAPTDQRLNWLRGDEWLFLEGMHPAHQRLRVQLPAMGIYVRLYGGAAATLPEHLPMRLDMVHVLVEQMRCSLVWRGKSPVLHESALAGVTVAAAIAPLEDRGASGQEDGLRTMPLESEQESGVPSSIAAPLSLSSLESTQAEMGDSELESVSELWPFPVAKGSGPVPDVQLPGAPWSPDQPSVPLFTGRLDETNVIMDERQAEAERRQEEEARRLTQQERRQREQQQARRREQEALRVREEQEALHREEEERKQQAARFAAEQERLRLEAEQRQRKSRQERSQRKARLQKRLYSKLNKK